MVQKGESNNYRPDPEFAFVSVIGIWIFSLCKGGSRTAPTPGEIVEIAGGFETRPYVRNRRV